MRTEFKLTNTQKKGALALLVILLLIVGIRYRAHLFGEKEAEQVVTTSDSLLLRSPKGEKASVPSLMIELNTADTAQLQQVKGIGKVLSKRIVTYRELIGGFSEVDQLMKLHGMSPENFLRIQEQVYVDTKSEAYRELQKNGKWTLAQQEKKAAYTSSYKKYPSKKKWPKDSTWSNSAKKNYPDYDKKPLEAVNLNRADSLTLDQVRGIGPKTAQRIIEKRKQLGFFHSLDQMRAEVYGINDENFQRMKEQLFVEEDLRAYPHIHVNQLSLEEMKAHRYISKTMARLIVAYREEHGAILDPEGLRSIYGLNPESIDRVLPYLIF